MLLQPLEQLTQREDDKSEEAINNRLEIYDTQTAPVLKYYEEKGIVQNEEITISKKPFCAGIPPFFLIILSANLSNSNVVIPGLIASSNVL